MDFAAIDFETANNSIGSVCAFGLVIVEKGQIVERVFRLVRPRELYFDYFNIKIHGITEEHVENEPEFDEVWPVILPLLKNRIVLAHNAAFDMSVLREVLLQYDLNCPAFLHSCTVNISRKTWPELMSHRLNAVAGYLGISFKHHDALEDALACAQIAIRACEFHNVNSIQELAEKLKIAISPWTGKSYRPATFHHMRYPNYVNPKDIIRETDDYNPGHPLFGATCVFTGNLKHMSRKEAMQEVVNRGGICANSVSSSTTYLIMGETDFARVKGGKSSKFRKAEQLIKEGLDIEILNETEFIKLLSSTGYKVI